MILFEFIKSGLSQNEQCIYVSEVKREISDGGIKADEFIKKNLLSVHQFLNLSLSQILI